MIPDFEQTAPAVDAIVSNFTDAEKSSFTDVGLAYDLATNLADKTTLTPILVAPEERLSGSGPYASGGFLVDRLHELCARCVRRLSSLESGRRLLQGFRHRSQLISRLSVSAADLFLQCQDEYKAGIERLIGCGDQVIAAISRAATSGGVIGAAEFAAIRLALDAIANHILRKSGDGQ